MITAHAAAPPFLRVLSPPSSSSPSPSTSSCIHLVSHNSSRHLPPSVSLFLLSSFQPPPLSHPRFSVPHGPSLFTLILSPFSISVPFWVPLPLALSLYLSVSLSPLLSLTLFVPPIFSPFLITCSQPHPPCSLPTLDFGLALPPTLSLPRGSPHPPIPPGTLVSSPICRQPAGEGASEGAAVWGLVGAQCWAEHWGKVFAQEEGVRSGGEGSGLGKLQIKTQHLIPVRVQRGASGRRFLRPVLETLPSSPNLMEMNIRLANTWHSLLFPSP